MIGGSQSKRQEGALVSRRPPEARAKFLKIAVGFVLFFSTIFVVSSLVSHVNHEKMKRSWIMTRGIVMSAELRAERTVTPKRLHKVFVYSPDIRYRYSADGATYDNDKYQSPSWSTSNRKTVEKIVAGFAVGESCVVYYDPREPSQSVLNISIPRWRYAFLVVGMIGYLTVPFLIGRARQIAKGQRLDVHEPTRSSSAGTHSHGDGL